MTILKILNYPDPRLKTVAKVVNDINEATVQRDIADMLETLVNTERCGGLASTQVDIKDPWRMFVFYDDQASQEKPVIIINPEIVSHQGEVFEDEGCMSVYPDYICASVHRPALTKIKGIDREGQPIQIERDGYLAKLFIHEIDHLNGKLYIDHLSSLKRKMLDKKITKARKIVGQQ